VLQPAVVALDPVVGVLLGAMPRRQQLLQDHQVGRRLIVTTSLGIVLGVLMARWKNRRAARRSHAGETKTSTTCPNWSIAR
jgi:hypothetical protein